MPIHVLAIDDDPAMTELLTLLLQSHGFKITTVNSGMEGIQFVREHLPDIVLLDLIMPGVGGQETCKTIRSFSNVPIIALSALNNPELVANALDAGADDYLIKPVPSSILIAHLKNLARRSTSRLTQYGTHIVKSTSPLVP